jgi:hydrogenase expression/formation protein HypE
MADLTFTANCPVPLANQDHVTLAHGGGGRMMHALLERVVLPAFGNQPLESRHDGAILDAGKGRLAFTTDSYVVHPLFFPGGDIGTLAVTGTVNDLAMCGARPLALSAGFILEEGLPMATLERVVASMARTARAAGVNIVTGDTKVVDRGKGDGLFVNTAGIGRVEHDLVSHRPRCARATPSC